MSLQYVVFIPAFIAFFPFPDARGTVCDKPAFCAAVTVRILVATQRLNAQAGHAQANGSITAKE
jgi:hypothetical protein